MNEPILIYAAGPIDLGADIPNWRQGLMNLLTEAKVTAVLFDPSTAYKTATWGTQDRNRSNYIEEVNKQALNNANYFVVCLPGKVPSVGTPMELDWASEQGIPILLLTDILSGKSVYLDNRVADAERFYCADLNNIDSVVQSLVEIANTIVKRTTGPQELKLKYNKMVDVDIPKIRREIEDVLKEDS